MTTADNEPSQTTFRLRGPVRWVLLTAALIFAIVGASAFSQPNIGLFTALIYGIILAGSLLFAARVLSALTVTVTRQHLLVRGSFRWRKFPLEEIQGLSTGDPAFTTTQLGNQRLYVCLLDGETYRPSDFGSPKFYANRPGSVPWIVNHANTEITRRQQQLRQ